MLPPVSQQSSNPSVVSPNQKASTKTLAATDRADQNNPEDIVQLSETAQNFVNQNSDSNDQTSSPSSSTVRSSLQDLGSPTEIEEAKVYLNAKMDQMERKNRLSQIESAIAFAEGLKKFEADYTKIKDTEPVPAIELQGDELEAARKLVSTLDPSVKSEDGTVLYVVDGKNYTFKPDGSATVNDNGVPTSEDDKQRVLDTLQGSIDRLNELTGGSSI
ncbi:hypothetical protein ABLO27_12850 [Roseibium sp. SCPC15]|uniref:hypothetical protein n=1 Tax=Roseibium sp. SCP15 TaxID=3141376 RepID=UPI00333CA2F3